MSRKSSGVDCAEAAVSGVKTHRNPRTVCKSSVCNQARGITSGRKSPGGGPQGGVSAAPPPAVSAETHAEIDKGAWEDVVDALDPPRAEEDVELGITSSIDTNWEDHLEGFSRGGLVGTPRQHALEWATHLVGDKGWDFEGGEAGRHETIEAVANHIEREIIPKTRYGKDVAEAEAALPMSGDDEFQKYLADGGYTTSSVEGYMGGGGYQGSKASGSYSLPESNKELTRTFADLRKKGMIPLRVTMSSQRGYSGRNARVSYGSGAAGERAKRNFESLSPGAQAYVKARLGHRIRDVVDPYGYNTSNSQVDYFNSWGTLSSIEFPDGTRGR